MNFFKKIALSIAFSGLSLSAVAAEEAEGNLIESTRGNYEIKELKSDEIFARVDIWACFAVFPGSGTNIYYKGAPGDSRSWVSYLAVNRCNNVNNTNQCYIQECRFGPY